MKEKVIGLYSLLVIGILVGAAAPMNLHHLFMDMDHKREHFLSLKEDIQQDLIPLHQYRCCLEDSCGYCIEKTPGHGEGASCDCLSDVVNLKHPCGECIGEIMEGHGNPHLAKYFASSIADEVGEQHLDELKQIIFEKYGIAVEKQI